MEDHGGTRLISPTRRRDRAASGGFTLLEVLIAIFVISTALLGILALLMASTKLASDVVTDSVAATLARSVFDSLREGARHRAFRVEEGSNTVLGFVFVHEGVRDGAAEPYTYTPPPLPKSPSDTGALAALRASDFTIFLPPAPKPGASGPSGGELFFVFPRPALGSAQVFAQNTYPGTDNWLATPVAGNRGSVYVDVKRIYWLKNRKPPNGATVTGTNPYQPPDASDLYGFAITVRRAQVPPLNIPDVLPAQTDGVKATDGLYQFEVLAYRAFETDPTARGHEPVPGGRFEGLVAIGP